MTSGEDKPFADKLNAIPKIVFSKTLDHAPWGEWDDATIVKKSAAKEVARLKQESGNDMVIWGSISLAQSLTNKGLIDEFQLIVCPVVLGSGKPLFRNTVDSFDMRLLNAKSFDRGTALRRNGAYLGTLPNGAPFPLVFLSPSRIGYVHEDDFDVERLVIADIARG